MSLEDNYKNNKGLTLSYPRIIVDSWDFKDDFGLALLDLAEVYKRWIWEIIGTNLGFEKKFMKSEN